MYKALIRNLIVILLLGLPLTGTAASRHDQDMSAAAIAKRLEPVGKVNISGSQAVPPVQSVQIPVSAATGKVIYQKICSDCHATGEVRSPKFGSHAAWAPRYAKGWDILYEHALHGFNFMPPKGTCDECADEAIKAAVRYMVEHSVQK